MSIPSVRFKPPPRKPGQRKPNGPPSGQSHRPNDRLVSLDFSSSDSSDDLPVIQTHQVKHTLIDIGPSSDDESKSEEEVEVKEVNWASKSAKPVNFRPRQQSSSSSNPLRQQRGEYSQNSDSAPLSAEQQASDSQQSGQQQQRRRRRVRKPKQKIIIEEEEDDVEEQGEIVVQRRPPVHQVVQQQQQMQQQQHIRQRPRTLEPKSQNKARDIETFIVVREMKKTAKKISADFRMMKNETAVFFSKLSKDEIGINYIISKSMPVMPGSLDNVGMLRKQEHGKRFTAYTNEEKMNDDRDSEAIGMAFVKLPEIKSKQRTFRISFRADGKTNFPISKRRELSRIAQNGDVHPELKLLVNKPPVIGPDGNLINYFGSMYVVDSLKNYIIVDEKDDPLFMIFKSSEASFTVKAKYPITPLMAFGLSIAIIEDCR